MYFYSGGLLVAIQAQDLVACDSLCVFNGDLVGVDYLVAMGAESSE